MDSIVNILEPADSFALMTLGELRTTLGVPEADTSEDANLQMLIAQYSAAISAICNRVFAREKVIETWRELDSRRIYLSHWPVEADDIESVQSPRGDIEYPPELWELEEKSGKLSLFAGTAQPIKVVYTGGYRLPDEAPDDLKLALTFLVRGARTAAEREAVAGIRSIAHKSARVMFFDTGSTSTTSKAGGGGTALGALSETLPALRPYMRFWV